MDITVISITVEVTECDDGRPTTEGYVRIEKKHMFSDFPAYCSLLTFGLLFSCFEMIYCIFYCNQYSSDIISFRTIVVLLFFLIS